MLLDVVRNPQRFRVRVPGTEKAVNAGDELTGSFLDDLPITDYRRYVRERREGLVRTREPLLVRHHRTLDGRLREHEALWLNDGEAKRR